MAGMGGMRPRFVQPGEAEQRGGNVAETKVVETETIQPASPVVALTMEQLKELIASAAGANQGGMSAEAIAKAFAQTQKRENSQAPMVSVFNPRGETEHPRPRFVAGKVTQNGIELETDTLTWEEIEAINALPPGEFLVHKANGTTTPLTVKHTRGMDGKRLERVELHWPCKDDHRHDHRSLFDYCLEVLEQADLTAEADRLRGLRRELDKERAALTAA